LDFRLLCLTHIVEIMMNSLSVLFWDRSSPSYFSRKLFKFGASANSLDHLDCSHGILAVFYNKFFISESKFLSPPLLAVVRTCACAISLDHLDFRLFMFGSHSYSKSGWMHCQFYFETEVHLPIFWGSCSNLDLMRILLIIWIAVWQYFIIKFFFQEANFCAHQWRRLLELALVLFLLTIWISDFLFLAHIASQNQDDFTVSFISRWKFISLFFEEAV